jgi:uncharacterized protein (TIGR02588 family)
MRRNWLEWLVTSVSLVAIVGLVGYLVVTTVGGGDRPPEIAVTRHLERARDDATGWLLPATVRNSGDAPATSVLVEARAVVDGKEQVSTLVIDLLAADTEIELVVGFSAEPEGDVTFRIVGYQVP